ncbi:hypothetical protein CALVIDRAFT_405576 [Calocera viscosa TUFC12733]|uniref:Uncharacterized protein n=1 Tax=Calocera viscosa (strain TUFC12733) TaxID=1330018 RepID=A0A167PXL2_CALVF|nr:hypothetical protein CALVIDRAFT_405576 [Calocera viscosa TUFC12733]
MSHSATSIAPASGKDIAGAVEQLINFTDLPKWEPLFDSYLRGCGPDGVAKLGDTLRELSHRLNYFVLNRDEHHVPAIVFSVPAMFSTPPAHEDDVQIAGGFDQTEASFELRVADEFSMDDLDMDLVLAEPEDVEMLLAPIDTPQPVNAGGKMKGTTALRKKEVEEVARVEESKDQPTVTGWTMTTRSMARTKLKVVQEHLEPEQIAGKKMGMRLRSEEKKARAKTVKQAKVEQQARVNIEKSQARSVRKQSKGKPTASGKGRARK